MTSLPAPALGSFLAVTTVELTIRMVVGLVVVGLLLLVLNKATRRVIDGRGGPRPAITIRHQQRLDKHASVTLLTAGGRDLLVGTTSQSIVLLAEGDDLTGVEPTRTTATTDDQTADGAGPGPDIDVRAGGRRHPIRVLQNKTVRRT